ncbi:MAG: tRNA 2-thiocytidine biosynthesis TtcA family protein, partial [Clostridia bacterium]
MQKILSLTRKCIQEYDMIDDGDTIAVGVSGGKDSVLLLNALACLKSFYPKKYTLHAITIDMGMDGVDFTPIAEMCAKLGVPYTTIRTNLKEIIFDIRCEKNPCSLCAKMRRGILHDAALDAGCNKVALGHHFDDAVETFMLSQVFEGRLSCFMPVTYLDRTKITLIRPLLYVHESMVRGTVTRLSLPVVSNPCPANGNTKRQEIKELLRELNGRYPG